MEKQVCDSSFLPVLLVCCRLFIRNRSIRFKLGLQWNICWTEVFSVLSCCRSALWWLTQFLTWILAWRHLTVRHPLSVKCFYIRLYPKSSQNSSRPAVLANVDKYAEIEYSMVSSPNISTSSINLKLKVKGNFTTTNQKNWTFGHEKHHSFFFPLLRASSTTSGSIRNLLSLLQPFLCHLRTTTCCTSACLLSPSTLQHLCTTELEFSACTSLMTW